MNATLSATQTDERPDTQPVPPIRIIRNGEWAILQSEAEMTDDERRAAYVAAFQIYGGW